MSEIGKALTVRNEVATRAKEYPDGYWLERVHGVIAVVQNMVKEKGRDYALKELMWFESGEPDEYFAARYEVKWTRYLTEIAELFEKSLEAKIDKDVRAIFDKSDKK